MTEANNENKIVLDDTSIEKFDPTVAELQGLVAKTKDLKATDLEDKGQMELVRTSRIELKKKRVAIEKYAKGLRDNATAWSRKVSAKEKELIGIIEPEEDRLKAIEAEAEQLAIRKERMEKLPARKERLQAIGDGVEVSDDDLLMMDANDFEGYYNARVADKLNRDREEMEAKKAKEKEEAEAKQREEDEKRRKENEAKEAELAAERKEIEEARLANERESARLQAEKEAREREERAREEEREKARKEEEARLESEKRAKEEAEKKEAEDKAKRERAERYKNWRAQFGWTPETAKDFYEKVEGEGKDQVVVLFKKLDTFHLNTLDNKSPKQKKYDDLVFAIDHDRSMWESGEEHPTDTDQFRRAQSRVWQRIQEMENEATELEKDHDIIKSPKRK